MDTQPPPDWSSLPIDLINLIGKFLNRRQSGNDVARFRAVCKTFRSSVPPPKIRSSYSHLKLPMSTQLQRYGNHIFLSVSTIYAIEPCLNDTCRKTTEEEEETTTKIWVVKVEETKSGKSQVRGPFNKFSSKKQMSRSLNLLDYQVTEIMKQYRLQVSFSDDQNPNGRVLKGVVASESLDEIDPGFTAVMAIHHGRLCAWRKGDDMWTDIQFDGNFYVTDVAFHGKRFYAISKFGCTVSMDPKSLKVTPVVGHAGYGTRLAKSADDLLLIKSFWFGLETLVVYKLDGEGKQEWVIYINSQPDRWSKPLNPYHLGSSHTYQNAPRMLFIGETNNCVYFTKEGMDSYIVNKKGYDFGFLDMKERIFHPNIRESYDIFRPPTWLKQPN